MNAFLFPGQGAQYIGMGKELLEKNPDLAFVFEAGSDILGLDLKKLCFDGTEEELAKTINSQPAIMAVSILAFETVKKYGIDFEAAAGHSLGEYAEMYSLGMISLEDAFKLIKIRATAMNRAALENEGSMAAILKLDAEKIAEICKSTEGYVTPVNYNSPVQTVIAGEKNAVLTACEKLSELKARVMPLKVASAFHSKLMQSASDEFYAEAKNFKFNAPSKAFFSNVYGKKLDDFSDMTSLLAKHIVSPVKFTDELKAMSEYGCGRFIELGCGRVLSGLVRATLKGAKILNIENSDTLEKALETINGVNN